MWRQRDCQRAQVENQDYLWTVQGDRRFYSKHLLLQAVTSVATEQTTSFSVESVDDEKVMFSSFNFNLELIFLR